MQTALDCIPCLVRQALDAARRVSDDRRVHQSVLRAVTAQMASADMRRTPPELAQYAQQLIRSLTGCEDPYAAAKRTATALALGMYDDLKVYVTQSRDPFAAAIRMAIAGNIIDLGVTSSVSVAAVEAAIERCHAATLDGQAMASLVEDLSRADSILYLGDNAGETVFDRLLLEQLPVRATYAVRGYPVLNDAVRRDAEAAGLGEVADIIDNGSDAPGTILEDCSDAFRRRFEASDVVIAKGQGNFETLTDARRDIYCLFKIKCAVVARQLNGEVNTPLIYHVQPSGASTCPRPADADIHGR